jgi:hypothetical protein
LIVARSIRYHLDEHIDEAIADGLRHHGIDVTRTPEVGLRGAKDVEHIAFAVSEQRCIVTGDYHFLQHAASGIQHFGMAHYPRNKRSIGAVIDSLRLIWETRDTVDLINRVEYL